MNLAGVAALGAAVLILWGAYRNVSPLDLLKGTLAGKPVGSPLDPNPGGASIGDQGASPGQGTLRDMPAPSNGWTWPVPGSRRITARFGQSGPMWKRSHTGLDIDGNTGDRIVASKSGIVFFAGSNGPYGLQVKQNISGVKGHEIWYNHLSRIEVRKDDGITAGQTVGRMGSTGNSTGSHLHIEIRINGVPQDPERFLK